MGHCFLFSPTGLAVLGCNSLGLEIPSYGQRDQSYKTGRIGGAGIGSQGNVPQRASKPFELIRRKALLYGRDTDSFWGERSRIQ